MIQTGANFSENTLAYYLTTIWENIILVYFEELEIQATLFLDPAGSLGAFGHQKLPSATLKMSELADFLIWLIY